MKNALGQILTKRDVLAKYLPSKPTGIYATWLGGDPKDSTFMRRLPAIRKLASFSPSPYAVKAFFDWVDATLVPLLGADAGEGQPELPLAETEAPKVTPTPVLTPITTEEVLELIEAADRIEVVVEGTTYESDWSSGIIEKAALDEDGDVMVIGTSSWDTNGAVMLSELEGATRHKDGNVLLKDGRTLRLYVGKPTDNARVAYSVVQPKAQTDKAAPLPLQTGVSEHPPFVSESLTIDKSQVARVFSPAPVGGFSEPKEKVGGFLTPGKTRPTEQEGVRTFDFHGWPVRTGGELSNPWFCVIDLLQALDDKPTAGKKYWPSKAVENLDEDEVIENHLIDSTGIRKQPTTCVFKTGMWAIIDRSGSSKSKEFRRWMRKDVLKSIDETGSFSIAPADPATLVVRSHVDAVKQWLIAQEEKEVLAAGKAVSDAKVLQLEDRVDEMEESLSKAERDAAYTREVLQNGLAKPLGEALNTTVGVLVKERQARLWMLVSNFMRYSEDRVEYIPYANHRLARRFFSAPGWWENPKTGEREMSNTFYITPEGAQYLRGYFLQLGYRRMVDATVSDEKNGAIYLDLNEPNVRVTVPKPQDRDLLLKQYQSQGQPDAWGIYVSWMPGEWRRLSMIKEARAQGGIRREQLRVLRALQELDKDRHPDTRIALVCGSADTGYGMLLY